MRVKLSNPSSSKHGSYKTGKSTFFEKVIPALLILMGIVMAALILLAAGVLLGFIHF